MLKKLAILFVLIISFINGFTQYSNNEDGQYEDMLTPEYYNTPNAGAFRLEVNEFVHFARQLPFQHPFEDSLEQIISYTINRSFGDGIGPGGTGSHHPAFDYHVGGSTQVNMYAAHDGFVTVRRDVERYRHYLSITSEIHDSLGNEIGKMVTLYAHIDLDLDSVDNLNMNGQYVTKGDLVSKHLYSGTMGGPHLHFEIRYYRSTDTALEDFYGGNIGGNTSPSSGSWMYGYWNPNNGYGFAHPLNQINTATLNVVENNYHNQIIIYPNPTKDFFTINIYKSSENTNIELLNLQGKLLEKHVVDITGKVTINLSDYPSGIYFARVFNGTKYFSAKILKE